MDKLAALIGRGERTARRHLHLLVSHGLVRRDNGGSWELVATTPQDLDWVAEVAGTAGRRERGPAWQEARRRAREHWDEERQRFGRGRAVDSRSYEEPSDDAAQDAGELLAALVDLETGELLEDG